MYHREELINELSIKKYPQMNFIIDIIILKLSTLTEILVIYSSIIMFEYAEFPNNSKFHPALHIQRA